MREKNYRKHIIRSVKGSIGRFLAIFGIVLLGVGFMSGMLSAAPDMRLSTDIALDDANFYDIRVIGTLGITEEDVAAMRKTEDVLGVMPCYTSDAIIAGDSGLTKVARISTLPFSLLLEDNESYINQLKLVSGRMPEAVGEAVLVKRPMELAAYKVGDKVRFTEDNDDLSETFSVDGFTVVGIVESPCYFSIDKESSEAGAGTVEANLFVGEENFCLTSYTDAYITVTGAKSLNAFEDEYEELVSRVAQSIESISQNRCEIRKAEAEDELKDARRELTQRKKELYEAEGQLTMAKNQITMMESAIPPLEEMLDEGKAQYEAGLALYEEEIGKAQSQLETAESAVNAATLMIELANGAIEDAEAEIERVLAEGDELRAQQLQNALDNLLVYYDGLLEEYDGLVAEYEAGLKLYNETKAEADRQLAEAEEMISSYETQLSDAKAQLAAAKTEYEAGKAELEEQKAAADPELEAAEADIAKAQELLDSVGVPEWYVTTREDDAAFSGFADNADRIAAIAMVFPVFFFLVAALVALTTMTRMIEEERTQIGTLKAIGYSKTAIAMKYLLYSETATLAGCAAGIAIGINLLPRVIWNTYGMMYTLHEVYTPFYPLYCISAVAAALLCTMIATVSACGSALKEVPSKLMLPKAPKAGKKVFLERIKFLWKHMTFTQKVTARNILRYKKRFFMTLFGIAGCTALLLTGFGLRDSITDIIEKQFTEIHCYDAMAALKNGDGDAQLREYLDETAEDYMFNYQVTASVKTDAGSRDDYVFVTESREKFPEFITLRNRSTRESIPLDDEGVVVTEKMAKELGVSKGDSVTVEVNGVSAELSVTGVAENYVYGYVYMTETLYGEKFGELENYNMITIKVADGADEKSMFTELLQNDSIAQVTSVSNVRETFANMLDKVNVVVWVLIVAAAMLAFVVLYNLTNININERRHEIATLKVLGFRQRETSEYIFREMVIITLIGTVVGLAFGILLWSFVVKTAEVSMVMFGREISALSFIISAVMTVAFSAAVFLAMTPKLKNIDMVESLKSGE